MRISSSPDDASYSPHAHLCRFWVAGSERNNVVTIDEERRFALLLRRDEFGAPALDKNGAQIAERYWGDVRVDCPAWLRVSQEHCSNEEGMGALGAAIQNWNATP